MLEYCIVGGIKIKKFLKSIDYSVLAIVLMLFVIGFIALYSANGGIDGDSDEAMKQLAWFGVSFIVMLVIMSVDYEVWGKLWIPLYAIMLLVLFLVLFTTPINRSNKLVYFWRDEYSAV